MFISKLGKQYIENDHVGLFVTLTLPQQPNPKVVLFLPFLNVLLYQKST